VRAVAWALIWVACACVAAWTLIAIPLSALLSHGRRGWRIAVAYDQLGNTAAGGHEDETFSSRCWGQRSKPRYMRLVRIIDWVFWTLEGERDHCKNAWHAENASARKRAESNDAARAV
jgi:hypothetical protein